MLYGREMSANRRMPLNLDWVEEIQVNTSAVERRAATIPARRSVKKEWQAAWLLRAIACMDLTTLSGDDSAERVRRLCAKARRPLQDSIVKALGIEELGLHVGRGVRVSRVCGDGGEGAGGVGDSGGRGVDWLPCRACRRWRRGWRRFGGAWRRGLGEIDIVITRAHVFNGEWNALYDEVAAFKEACGAAHMKAILGTGDLLTLRNVARASWVAMMAGADFIKTSTGKEAVNATLPVSLVMVRALREYGERTGMAVGFKPAGGIKTAKQALDWMATMKDELGGRGWSLRCFDMGLVRCWEILSGSWSIL
jgi:deoxyribose-phosphate aldolase